MSAELLSAFTPSTMSVELLEEIFVKREPLADDILTSIAEAVLQPPGRRDLEHHLVVGPRGIGKTHLLTIVANRLVARPDLRGRVVVARLREEEWGVSTAGELLEQVVRQLAADDQPDAVVRRAAAAELPALAAATIDTLEDIAAQVVASVARDRLVVVAVENVDDLFASLGADEQHALRARLQNDRNLVLLASTPSLGSSISSRSGLWFGFFDIEHLDELDITEARELLLRLVRLGRSGGDPGLIEFLESDVALDRLRVVQRVVGGHPRLWMLMADCITTQRLDEVVGLILAVLDDLTPYYQSQMKALTPQQRKIVVELTRRSGAVTVGDLARSTRIGERVAAKQVGDLSKLGYVRLAELPEGVEVADKRQRRYELREPLLRHSLEHKESRGRPLSMIVEFLRAWFDRPQLEEWAAGADGLAAACARAALAQLGPVAGADSGREEPLAVLSVVERRLDLDPLDAEAHFDRGAALAAMERWEEALAEFDASIELGDRHDPAHYNRGVALAELGRLGEALAAFDSALTRDPADQASHYNRGVMLGELGRWAEALSAYDESARLGPDDEMVHNNRGVALAQLERWDDALAAFDEAVRVRPTSASRWSRTQIAALLGRSPNAQHVRAAMSVPVWSPVEADQLRRSIEATRTVPAVARRPWVSTWVDAALSANRLDELVAAVVPSLREDDRGWSFDWLATLKNAGVESPLVDALDAVASFLDDRDGSAFLELPVELRDVAYELAGFNRPERKLRLRADP